MKSQVDNRKITDHERDRKVFVGLSGGVDSAVSLALLKKEGYDVTGVFIKTWTPEWLETECTWKEDRRSAMRVAAILDIPFITLDLEKEYKEGVADYMINEYKSGRTPNPDIMCNKEIKFGAFLKFALKNGADFVATGHYGRNELRGMNYELYEGRDKNKDQSYFLWTLTQEQLNHILFPVGNLQKEEVRKLAGKFGLPQATRKDSQGICFLGDIDMKEFLSHYIPKNRGSVLNTEGEVIGHHDGALFFTLGERHGFTITEKTPDTDKLYVISKDIEKNTITVASKITPYQKSPPATTSLTSRAGQGEPLTLRSINWISGKIPDSSEKITARIRYRGEKLPCKIIDRDRETKVQFERETIISPGQSVVFYRGDICLGGGIIA